METPNSDQQLTKKYFDKELSSSESKEFKRRLSENAELLEKVSQKELLIKALQEADRENAKADLKKLYQEYKSESKSTKKLKFPYYKVAAGLVLLLLAGAYFIFNNSFASSNQELANTYFEAFTASPVTRSDENSQKLIKSIQAYQNENFKEAIEGFISKADINDNNNRFNLLTATCYFKLGQAEKALPFLKPLEKSEDAILKDYALWYQALCFLKLNKEAESKVILEELINSKSLFSEKAKEVKEAANF